MIYLKEIKLRILYSFLFFIFIWMNTYIYSNQYIHILIIPLKNEYLKNNKTFNLIFTEISEIFFIQTKLTTWITIFLFIPIILYQLWLFFKGGLYEYEKKYIKKISIILYLFGVISTIITYIIIIPLICKYFLSFEITGYKIFLEAKINEYIINILNIFLMNYIFFQIPFLILNINKPNILKKRKIIYFIILFLNILITPYDLLNQLLFLIFFLIIYELGLYITLCANVLQNIKEYKNK